MQFIYRMHYMLCYCQLGHSEKTQVELLSPTHEQIYFLQLALVAARPVNQTNLWWVGVRDLTKLPHPISSLNSKLSLT